MLRTIAHLGTHEARHGYQRVQRRRYAVQATGGARYVVALFAASVDYGRDPRVTVALDGTDYAREYPAAGELDADQAPRIADLDGGYRIIAAFLDAWDTATAEQRADLCEYDTDIPGGRGMTGYSMAVLDRPILDRHRWTIRRYDDIPRHVPGTGVGGGGGAGAADCAPPPNKHIDQPS